MPCVSGCGRVWAVLWAGAGLIPTRAGLGPVPYPPLSAWVVSEPEFLHLKGRNNPTTYLPALTGLCGGENRMIGLTTF